MQLERSSANRPMFNARMPLTEDLVANVVLANEVSQQFLIHTCCVDHSSIPESTAQLNGFEEHGLSFFETEVAAQAVAQAHGSEARGWDFNVLKFGGLDHGDVVVDV